jgi:hypothetical protein
MSKPKKSPRDHLVERYGEPPEELQHAIVPPAEWTAAMIEIGPHGKPYNVCEHHLSDFVCKEFNQQRLYSPCSVHDVYYEWCHREQKRRRLISLGWTHGLEDKDITKPAQPLYRTTGKANELEFVMWWPRERVINPLRDLAKQAEEWPPIVWTLAEAIFLGLRMPPDPYKRGPSGAKKRAHSQNKK